ncbi:MAG: hypothetical protein R3296_08605 [Oleiphilaceae bacterium]|nr:hypothetical protein [Oleiphilaceae bacterium]
MTDCRLYRRNDQGALLWRFLALVLVALLASGVQASEALVSGTITALEKPGKALIVDGRSHRLADPVEFDGQILRAEKALALLSPGDGVILVKTGNGSGVVERIHSQLQ